MPKVTYQRNTPRNIGSRHESFGPSMRASRTHRSMDRKKFRNNICVHIHSFISFLYIYIFIYFERDRERELKSFPSFQSIVCLGAFQSASAKSDLGMGLMGWVWSDLEHLSLPHWTESQQPTKGWCKIGSQSGSSWPSLRVGGTHHSPKLSGISAPNKGAV